MRKKVIGTICVLLLFLAAVGGVIYWRAWIEVRTAEQMLHLMLSDIEQQLEEVSSFETEETLVAWLENRYGAFFTEEGLETALKNRVFLLGISDAKKLQNATIDIRKRGNMDNWYIADICSKSNDAAAAYRLLFQMKKVDGVWLISSISR